MKPEDMPIVEIENSCRFSSERKLAEHVCKHLIEGRDERWHRVLDDVLLSAARDEWKADGSFGSCCQRLAAEYERVLADSLLKVCAANRWHQHVAEYDVLVQGRFSFEELATAQVIEAWPIEDRLWIVAGAGVRDGMLRAYSIRTGYRPWPKLTPRGFARATKQRSIDRRLLHRGRFLAIHDAED